MRLATLKNKSNGRHLLQRKSTQRVKFEDFTESHFSTNHRKSLSDSIAEVPKLSKAQLKEEEFRVRYYSFLHYPSWILSHY